MLVVVLRETSVVMILIQSIVVVRMKFVVEIMVVAQRDKLVAPIHQMDLKLAAILLYVKLVFRGLDVWFVQENNVQLV
tara:strand:+ start:342 stop:575 length:234 start_codon:yes stop_codon:yes gene_type:complete